VKYGQFHHKGSINTQRMRDIMNYRTDQKDPGLEGMDDGPRYDGGDFDHDCKEDGIWQKLGLLESTLSELHTSLDRFGHRISPYLVPVEAMSVINAASITADKILSGDAEMKKPMEMRSDTRIKLDDLINEATALQINLNRLAARIDS
jgi:hypothetical protein